MRLPCDFSVICAYLFAAMQHKRHKAQGQRDGRMVIDRILGDMLRDLVTLPRVMRSRSVA